MARQHTAWVLEDRPIVSGIPRKYLSYDGSDDADLSRTLWVADPKDALRFDRREDAHNVSVILGVSKFCEPFEATFD